LWNDDRRPLSDSIRWAAEQLAEQAVDELFERGGKTVDTSNGVRSDSCME
jgi:hypothetical protein